MPLILPVHVVCNVADEEIYGNIRVNSHAHPTDWVQSLPAHDGTALLCGSGPSLADTVEDIRARQHSGAVVFALNGAAKYLAERGIMPDYQVIIDARERTAELVGPAKQHLFASQVHPKCFELAPGARLWHLQVENIDEYLPEYDDAFVMVGGAASVGNTATCLAYSLGFRDLHCFGYDSCHRDGNGHAFHQAMNDGDPCAVVEFGGKTYIASLTMKLQAERFMTTARELERLGATIAVHGDGLLPAMWNIPQDGLTERQKYERVWCFDDYRTVAPGEQCVKKFLEVVKPAGFGKVIDFGCGTGRAALKLDEAGLDVFCLDFASNARDLEAWRLPFRVHDLTDPIDLRADYGFCTDVMEHVPPEHVRTVLQNIIDAAPRVFFQISTVDDVMGELVGLPLHLSVHPASWWIDELELLGCRVRWLEESAGALMVYVEKVQ